MTLSPLAVILEDFRTKSLSERDKGTLFEQLMVAYFKHEPVYQQQYKTVLPYADWVSEYQPHLPRRDTGIDLVAVTYEGRNHAIQCKNYALDHKVVKSDIDSFFTASGKNYFSHRIIVATTNLWSDNVKDSLHDQFPPVSVVTLHDLENSKIDWSKYHQAEKPVLQAAKELRPHQQKALRAVKNGFDRGESRGKLIMACGTGKTFASLKIAEEVAGSGKRILFLVPSLALLSQTLREWTQDSSIRLNNFAVCSDSDVGKKKSAFDDDRVVTSISDLNFPATTHAKNLADAVKIHEAVESKRDNMTVVYSTYHSLKVISDAQRLHDLPEFDLIICDEAHRTTGATFDGEDESAFVKIHDQSYVQGKRRLYMTATPRIYGEDAKKIEGVELCSMDDQSMYGREFFTITFSQAVAQELLVDYKVLVLAINEADVGRTLVGLLGESNELKVNDAAKIVGCWKALAKQDVSTDLYGDAQPMKRAVAFCQVIGDYGLSESEKTLKKEGKRAATTHKVSSTLIAGMFSDVVEAYKAKEIGILHAENPDAELPISLSLKCEAEHVDGSMNASEKEAKLNWLKEDFTDGECRILSNVRCLSEGVDVPSLDAVLFLTPRSSQVDVVQSVGRVMRRAPEKKQGYVILPVVVPAGVNPEDALDKNENYKVVWQVLNALRAHDDRFDAMINKLEFNGKDTQKMEVIAIANSVHQKQRKSDKSSRRAQKAQASYNLGKNNEQPAPQQQTIEFEIGEIERALYAKIVKKCGNRHHWEDWANDIAKIAQTHIERIKAILAEPGHAKEKAAFNAFASELRDDLNNSISDEEIVEMLAQHLITKPVFDALFKDYSFAEHNPMSLAMQQLLDLLQEHHLKKETDTLQSFYDSVKMRAEGIESAEGKQKIVVELYDKFFRNAFPRMTERLGIVYTPVEVVDFIIHSVEDVLQQEFGKSLADKGVHILDPFTGTGTFITRLLQSGIIPADKLPEKYQNEIHANEIVLLAYYIAAINIEATYHAILSGNIHGKITDNKVPYTPFEGICLTDTFQMYEKEDLVDALLEVNSGRRKRQKQLDIRVIIGNPPYSAGQESANDNNANVAYPGLDGRIRQTYAAYSTATNKNALYDSYIRAIRWASDRIGDTGILGFVTNGGYIDANTADGLRKSLVQEFSTLYIFHLRGNQRTAGERSRKEGGKIFGSGSRAPIAISILVKNPNASEHGKIYFHDIGNYLNREQKLKIIEDFTSIKGITQQHGWQEIVPDEFGDWLNQRDPNFDTYISLGDKKDKDSLIIFENYSRGAESGRDNWVYNFSKKRLINNLEKTINFFNSEVKRYQDAYGTKKIDNLNSFIKTDEIKISWSSSLIPSITRGQYAILNMDSIVKGMYRPFIKTNIYFNSMFVHRVAQMPKIFPQSTVNNLTISITGRGSTKEFSILISNVLPDLECISKSQCFPLYLYENTAEASISENQDDLFTSARQSSGYTRKEAITDGALKHFQEAYPGESLTKEDIFYYIYGLLHSEEYRERYADNLSKQLPRIPRVKIFADFMAFSQAGRQLADLHLNYETVAPYPVKFTGSLKHNGQDFIGATDTDFYVTQMKFAQKNDKTKVIYNGKITMENIPEAAYDYIVNGKSALEWVMERQAVTIDKKSGITNDANDWAIETMDNARYPLELFQRVITVSLETQKIVNSLPKLDI